MLPGSEGTLWSIKGLKGKQYIANSVTEKKERDIRIRLTEESLERIPDPVKLDPDELQKYAERALDIGLRILQQISVVEGIGQQAEEIVRRVNTKAGEIPDEVAEAVKKLIGTEEGQVLRPVQLQLETLLRLTDPSVDASVPKWIEEMTKSGFSEQAEPLVEAIEELQDALVVAGIIDEYKEGTPLKGDYEDHVNDRLQEWADKSSSLFRPNVEFTKNTTGSKQKTTGDVVVEVKSESGNTISICVEAKNYGAGNKRGKLDVERSLDEGISNRNCIAGLYVNKERSGFSDQLGYWYEGVIDDWPYVVVTDEYLELGIRSLISRIKINEMSSSTNKLDTTTLTMRVEELKAGIKTLNTMKNKANRISTLSGEIEDLAQDGYQDLGKKLTAIEKLIEDAAEN